MPNERRVLAVQHQDDCPPALLGTWLTDAGCVLDVRRPYAGDTLPSDLDDHQGLLVLGGSMGANDDADHVWLGPTKQLVRVAASNGVPTLGVCLGHQLAAAALGGTVEVNPLGREFGVLPLGWTGEAAADPVLGRLPARVIHWNNDVVTKLPAGATPLAYAPDGAVQAARLAETVWGLQPHPEVDKSIVARWAADERSTIDAELGAGTVDATLAEMTEAGPELARAWQPVAAAFARLVASYDSVEANQPDGPTSVPMRGTY